MRATALLLASLVVACATPSLSPTLPAAGRLMDVPFYSQSADDCGPASLAMVLSWSGIEMGPQALIDEVYTASRSGALPSDIVSAARRHGRVPYPSDSLDGLLGEVAAGHPVLVLQNLAFWWKPVWHYAVVVGYDRAERTIELHTGTTPRRSIPLSTFERTWARADHWARVVLRPGELPAQLDSQGVLHAALALEEIGRWQEAEEVYTAASERWPRSLAHLMGVGNARYAQGNLEGARAAFALATQRHPNAASAFNNLAQVLFESGNLTAARSAASRALGIGGPLAVTYGRTLADIERAAASQTEAEP